MSARRLSPGVQLLGAAALLTLLPSHALAQAQPAPAPDAASPNVDDRKEAIWSHVVEPKDEDSFKFDYGVPAAPALTLLGVEEGSIAKSNSLKPFVLSLPNLFDSQGGGKAVALDISPAWFTTTLTQRSFSNYTGSRPLWFRTHVGVALYEGVADTDPAKQKPSRLSFGVSSSLLDSSDPVLAAAPGQEGSAWLRCYNSGKQVVLASLPQPTASAEYLEAQRTYREIYRRKEWGPLQAKEKAGTLTTAEAAQLAKLYLDLHNAGLELDKGLDEWQAKVAQPFAESEGGKVVTGCLRVANHAARMGNAIDVGVGGVLSGQPGRVAGLGDPVASFWTSFRTPLGVGRPGGQDYQSLIKWADENKSWFMLGGSGHISLSAPIATGDTAKPMIRANTYTGWVGVERNADDSRFTVQIGFRRIDPRLAADKGYAGTRTVYLVAFDRRISDSLWASISYGRASGAGALKDDSTVRMNLTFDAPGLRKIFGD